MADNVHGIVAGLETSFPIAMLMSALLSIAFFSALELYVWILSTFRKRRGLYFWSLIVATSGIILNGLGYTLKFFRVTTESFFSVTIICLGWTCMVTGQSVVLYSRLHLVVTNEKLLHCVLTIIVINALAIHIPVTVLVYFVNSPDPRRFVDPYEIYERTQLVIFAVQEALISGIYIYYAKDILTTLDEMRKRPRRAVMKQVIYINIILMALDSILIGLQFAGLYEVQTSLKPAIYGLKLKLEFNVLNQLLRATKDRSQDIFFCWSGADTLNSQFVQSCNVLP
ncbi:hypothetical protein E8E12_010470 [Didymella heteroderae]|uniref:DUF7703 domain-containing protein n=1 Tax=Didymella heteroderae TaxID=1769908 RepID=A0A9P4WX05_9PLEO|nr:hypothetical protein E8E12_010470 [Didymella heteroderae]